jgi:hypothetical protein
LKINRSPQNSTFAGCLFSRCYCCASRCCPPPKNRLRSQTRPTAQTKPSSRLAVPFYKSAVRPPPPNIAPTPAVPPFPPALSQVSPAPNVAKSPRPAEQPPSLPSVPAQVRPKSLAQSNRPACCSPLAPQVSHLPPLPNIAPAPQSRRSRLPQRCQVPTPRRTAPKSAVSSRPSPPAKCLHSQTPAELPRNPPARELCPAPNCAFEPTTTAQIAQTAPQNAHLAACRHFLPPFLPPAAAILFFAAKQQNF